MKRNILLAIIATLLVCLCCVIVGAGGWFWFSFGAPQLTARNTLPAPTPMTTSARPTVVPTSVAPTGSNATADALLREQVPARNLYQIVPRLRKSLALLTPVPTPVPRAHNVGDHDEFFVIRNASTGEYRTTSATLQVITPHALFWVEDGMKFDLDALGKSADFFETRVYPTNVKYFGDPGVGLDGDMHIHILNTRFEDAAGYFSSVDTHPLAFAPYSNQRHIIYMNIEALTLNNNEYNGDLAHEFQHLIHSYQAPYATGWIDEGMGDLAIKVNGFPVLGVIDVFARRPDTQLNTWGNTPNSSAAHYAASYLFFDYVAGRYGPEMIRDIIHAPREGIPGVQAVLDQRANGLRFDDLFADWAVTNIVNDPKTENGRYAYSNEDKFRVTRVDNVSQYPITRTVQLPEYSASYFALAPDKTDVTLYFTGTTTVKLIPADAHGGKWMWYSNRADMADTTLTRSFDLTRANKTTLQFWTWYDIETNYDYAYVEGSTDGGKTWDVLPGKNTTTSDPNGASYGHALTGRSGVADDKSQTPARWVQEQMDLSPYAGKTILLRFEYITDDAYNAPSWAIDDISIPEIGYADDVESGDGGWQAAGFIRTDNVLPQKYIVQVSEVGGATRIVRVPLDAQNRGSYTITGFGKNITRATLVVTAHAPTTTEPTEFQLGVVPR
jgi:immune inhibitor A